MSYQRLRDAIATGELMPSQRLVESGLATSLGVGRAAVRTAIARLAQERLVERLPNRGARVRRVSDKEVIEVLELRMALECLVARHAALNATPEGLQRLNRILEEMESGSLVDDVPGYGRTNVEFHRALLQIARHETAARVLESLLSNGFQLQRLATTSRPHDRTAEHRAIATAIAAKDPDAAEAAMRTHLSGILERTRLRLASAAPRQLRALD